MGAKVLQIVKLTNLGTTHGRTFTFISSRCLHKSTKLLATESKPHKHKSPQTDVTEGEHLTPLGGIKTYIIKKYVSYIERSELKVEQHYPRFYKVYKLFKTGIAEFFNDTKQYSVIATRIWAGEDLTKFMWKELEIYRQMPGDLLRSAPVLIAAPLPAVPYFFYPICYMFPRQLLCQYFWTPQQREEFGLHDLRKRLPIYPKIVELLERHSLEREIGDTGLRKLFQDILFKLEHGEHASVEELIEVKNLFIHKPFGLDHISKLQLWYLARSLDFSTLSRKRFMNDAVLLHNIDLALIRKGCQTLGHIELQQSCFYRGYNAADQEDSHLHQYLQQWINLSQQVNESSLSLLLHAPVLLSYNKTSNKKYMLDNVDVRSGPR